MSWTQEGTYWRRPLDCHDKLFQSIVNAGKPLGREHWLMPGVVRLGFPAGTDGVERRLRNAWASLRLRHPDIATELRSDGKRYEPIQDTKALETWVTNTFRVESTVSSADELFSRHLKVTGASSTCHWIPASNEVAIVSSHWRCDGLGMIKTLHEFLVGLVPGDRRAELPTLGEETSNLVPSLDVLMNIPETRKTAWLRRAEDIIAPFREGPSSIGLPATIGALPGDTCRVETVVSSDDTAALLTACRARHIRLTAALYATLVTETTRYQEPNTNTGAQFKSWAPFDLRKHSIECFNDPPRAHSLRMLALPLVIDGSTDWNSLATYFQTFNEQSFAPADSDLMFVRVPFVEAATKILATIAPSTEPNLSNLGVMDEYVQKQYGDVEVRGLWIAVQMLSPQLWLHSWSWNGELHISSCYNEVYYDRKFVEGWLEKFTDSLLEHLGVRNNI